MCLEKYESMQNDDFVGTVKNRFIVTGKVRKLRKNGKKYKIYYKCLCNCGNTFYRDKYEIIKHVNGACSKCKRIRLGLDNHTRDSLYRVYYGMKQRCYNKNAREYHNYGERGICICDEWLYDYYAFKKWCLSHGYKKGLQLDRIDNSGNYSPDNCKFSTPMENSNNKRTCVYITHNNKVHTINEWSRILGINKNTFWRYIRVKGYSIEYIIKNKIGGG